MMLMRILNFIQILIFLYFNISISYAETASPLVHSVNPNWTVKPLLNVGEGVGKNAYRMVGIPDGLGAFKNNDQTITILMNHELHEDKGIKRLHGTKGAFVSKWVLNIENLNFMSGEDLVKQTMLWSVKDQHFYHSKTNQFNRLCSADLAPISAFFNAQSNKGYQQRLFLNGEENKQGGRAFAHIASGEDMGTSYELPHLGKFSWENAVAHPATGDLTLVAGMDDNQDGQVYFYIGEKRHAGNPVEKAGLVGGKLYAIQANGERFALVSLGDVSAMSAEDLEQAGQASGVTKFMRPEDGAWDIKNPNVFYFATTAKIDGDSQVFQLRFDDVNQPAKGGEIKVVLNAKSIGAQMFDNLTVTSNGSLLIQEDPGNNQHLAATWHFDPVTDNAEKILEADPKYFQDKTSPFFITQDEENSGVIEITELVKEASWAKKGQQYFLATMQVHAQSDDPELVEGGQLYLISSSGQ
jgi:hypothetical protein